MTKKTFCGYISHNGTTYGVLLEEITGRVWVNKPDDLTFGEGNYNNVVARNRTEAIEHAQKMLVSIGI